MTSDDLSSRCILDDIAASPKIDHVRELMAAHKGLATNKKEISVKFLRGKFFSCFSNVSSFLFIYIL